MSSNVKAVAWQGEPLKRGRHDLTPEAVRSSQRERLLRAMIEHVAHDGYAATTVPQVVATARVSRNAFYEFFADKQDCFTVACHEAMQSLLETLLSLVDEPDWIRATTRGTEVYLRWWTERPAFARSYLLELPAVGEAAAGIRERTYELYRAMYKDLARRARAEQPDLPPLGKLVPRFLVLAITELVAEEVRAGRIEQLPQLERQLTELVIRLLADDDTAARSSHPER